MRTKRLLCVCAALALLLSVPARAAESPDVPETPETWEETTVDPTPEETTGDPEEVPEIPEVPPETEEPPEVPEDSDDPPEDPEAPSEEDESPAPAEDEELPEESESPEESDEKAGDEAENGSEEEPPVIHVVVPDTGRIVVNPYGLEVNMDGMISTDQIVSAPMPIVSYSSVPVAVVASVTGHTSPGSDVVFVPTLPRSDAWAKELFLFAEFQPALDEYGSAFWSGQYTGAPNQLVVTAGGSSAAQVLELAAGDVVPSCGVFRLFGSAAVTPENPWCAEDAIQVTVAFTFVPLA